MWSGALHTVDRLDDRMVDFVNRQEMVFVTFPAHARHGGGERTSRTGPPGFVRVSGRRMLAWPEFRSDGMPVTGPVRLFFVDLFRDVAGLHVQGRATISPLAPLQVCDDGVADRAWPRRPDYWVRVHVDAAWFVGSAAR